MTATHHVSDELLLAYAAGNLPEGWSLVVATHLALCPSCRRRVAEAEAIGGEVLSATDPAEGEINPVSLDQIMSRIDGAGRTAQPRAVRRENGDVIYPEPLRSYLGDTAALPWKRLGGIQQIKLAIGDRTTTVRLLKIPGGQPMPVHGHRGLELTLVLAGSFSDDHGTFARGDIEEADEAVEHQPIADPGADCICLAVTDAPLRFRGFAALLQPFLRI